MKNLTEQHSQLALEAMAAQSLHPRDPRVVLTPVLSVFIAAAKNPLYRAVILEEPQSTVLTYRFAYGAIDLASAGNVVDIPVRVNDEDTASLPMETTLAPIHSAISDMVSLYHEITGERDTYAVTSRIPLGSEMHPHPKPVLNRVVFSLGTRWINPEGEEECAPEGALFYIKENFLHAARSEGYLSPRTATIISPADMRSIPYFPPYSAAPENEGNTSSLSAPIV